jgi:predicted esterase
MGVAGEHVMGGDIEVERGIRYGAGGKLLDIYRPAITTGPVPLVLLWHGSGPDERDVLAPLAGTAARLGMIVMVPDWRPDAADGGRAHLHRSLEFAYEHAAALGADPALVLAGWSRGGTAAIGIATNPETAGSYSTAAVVGIAAGYDTAAPTTGTSPLDDLDRQVRPRPIHLTHGTNDPVVDIRRSTELFAALRQRDWPVSITTPDTDHAGIVMTQYDPRLRRCRPTRLAHAVAAGTATAHVLAYAAGLTAPIRSVPPPGVTWGDER